jgi:hypothetical protein
VQGVLWARIMYDSHPSCAHASLLLGRSIGILARAVVPKPVYAFSSALSVVGAVPASAGHSVLYPQSPSDWPKKTVCLIHPLIAAGRQCPLRKPKADSDGGKYGPLQHRAGRGQATPALCRKRTSQERKAGTLSPSRGEYRSGQHPTSRDLFCGDHHRSQNSSACSSKQNE